MDKNLDQGNEMSANQPLQQLPLLLLSLLFSASAARAQAGKFPEVFFEGGSLCPDLPQRLVFADEFDGDTLDRTKWATWYTYGPNLSDSCAYCRTHGEEGQIYRDENVVVENGVAKLVARRKPGSWYGQAREYTSGMVHSKRAFTNYGRYEIRCKIPSGMGFWPAFWMFGWSTEMDVFEFGTQHPRRHYLGLIRNNRRQSYHYQGADFSKDFHTFALQYEPYFVHYEVDGQRVHTIARLYSLEGKAVTDCTIPAGQYRENPVFPRHGDPIQVIAGLGVGTARTPFTKAPNRRTTLPNQMEIDFIRVYQVVDH